MLQGLERYIHHRKKLLRWQYIHARELLKFGFKKWRANICEHVDTSYCSLWDIADKDLILNEYRLISQRKLLPNSITDKLERFYSDQTVLYENSFRRFEPQQCVKTIDQITDEYLTNMVQMHAGRTQVIMGYISLGTGTTTPDRTDTELGLEVTRKNILDEGGYIDFYGHNELYGLIFPFSQADITCTESGLHNTDSATTDIMACRNKYSPGLVHTQNSNAISINLVIQHRAF